MQTNTIRAGLSPMAGYTDHIFRTICSSLGAAYTVSEMISSVALTLKSLKTSELTKTGPDEGPVIIQIFGHDPVIMAQSAEMILSSSFAGCSFMQPPSGIDINMGCPVRKIVASGDGSALAENIHLAYDVAFSVKKVCEKYNKPLSVKFRLGPDQGHENYIDLGLALAAAGADLLTLHTRTREQMYAPSAAPEKCLALRNALDKAGYSDTRLCGNGDVVDHDSAMRYLAAGCSEVSVGRAALGNPWIFRELSSPGDFQAPSRSEIRKMVISLVEAAVHEYGEKRGIRESRSRAAYFIHGLPGSAKIREKLNLADSLSEFREILETYSELTE